MYKGFYSLEPMVDNNFNQNKTITWYIYVQISLQTQTQHIPYMYVLVYRQPNAIYIDSKEDDTPDEEYGGII